MRKMNKELIKVIRLHNVPMVPGLESLVTLHESIYDLPPMKSIDKSVTESITRALDKNTCERIHGLY